MSVTCVLPVHNGERFLEEALGSVLDQEVEGLQVVVVDDGSTDGTPEVLAAFGDRIRVIRQDNAGVAAARNRGLEAVDTEFVAFQDADDLWMPGKLRRQLHAFGRDPELEMAVGLVQNFWMDELAHEEAAYRGSRFAAEAPGYLLQCILVRRTVFDRIGRFEASLRVGEDNDWFLRARDAGVREHRIEEVLVRRRLHTGNLTRSDLASREAILRNMKASLDRRRSGGPG